ncbi:acyl-CoA dehydrogenase family protein [Sporichthya sp.]|uniref:acyl-CoA dehydrogenase family protein n=1 Tax=Sporichthya sp. TaxID=65475 RepID=UPI0017BCE656|nr:acyl-CoA dehydrogenase family protein [Sporichthya sp.]MBA3741432.1 acyl-CoA/acyl-ACP dehydrogenase [Sporichthya sp.]
MTLTSESDLELIRKTVRGLANRFTLDYWREKDQTGTYPWEFIRAFAEGGWMGAMIPEEYGGLGLGLTESGVMLHEIALSGAGTGGVSAIHFSVFPSGPILRHGSEEMKRTYLPELAAGRLLMAFGVSEPDAGFDTSRISTRAVREGGKWHITGRKVWITNAQNAHRLLLLARTSPRNEERPLDGMTLFFTDLNRDRIDVREIEKLGRACVDSNELFIDDLVVGDEDVIGEVGKGFRYLLDGLNPERIVVGMEQTGLGRCALGLAVDYANQRVVFDRPIGKNQAIAHPLADSWIRLHAAERVAMHAAALFDQNLPCGPEANAAKFLGSEAGFEACDRAMQTFGSFSYSKEFHIERLWRESRLLKIAPVSQEMVLNFVATNVLGLPKSY